MELKILSVLLLVAPCCITTVLCAGPVTNISPNPDCSVTVPKCVQLSSQECFGASLPYSQTSLGTFADDIKTQEDALSRLHLWSALRAVPQCWDVVQPLLCAVYLPKCELSPTSSSESTPETYLVQLPSRELCDVVRTPCRVVERYGGWPDYLKCDQGHFRKGCRNDVLNVRYNTTSSCIAPLVPTKSQLSFFPNVDGCGIQCENPLFTTADHRHARLLVAVFGTLCLFCTLFTLVTFTFDWKSLSRYPAVILFFINGCFFISTIGWMAQFVPGAGRDIVCRSDGTPRIAEPQIGSAGESASCTVIFILVYYFTIAAVVWFAILAYAWHLTFRAFNSTRDVIEGRKGHFHLLAWSLPLVLTIVCLAVTQVDGDSLSGVCFVGNVSIAHRGGFVLLPVGLFAAVGLTFLVRGLVTLARLQVQSPGLISDDASSRIRETIIRIGVFASVSLVLVLTTFGIHAYIFISEPSWKQALSDYIVCTANSTVVDDMHIHHEPCQLSNRPSLLLAEIHMLTYFVAGIVMSSWVWQKSTLKAWKRKLTRWCCSSSSQTKPEKVEDKLDTLLNRPKVIPQRDVNPGRSSLSFVGLNDDPFGHRFDLTSVSSREFSSTWSAAMQPYMIHRRSRAVTPLALQSAGFGRLQRRHSESDIQSITSIWTQNEPAPDVQAQLQVAGLLAASDDKNVSSGTVKKVEESNRKNRQRHRRIRHGNRITPMAKTVEDGQWQNCGWSCIPLTPPKPLSDGSTMVPAALVPSEAVNQDGGTVAVSTAGTAAGRLSFTGGSSLAGVSGMSSFAGDSLAGRSSPVLSDDDSNAENNVAVTEDRIQVELNAEADGKRLSESDTTVDGDDDGHAEIVSESDTNNTGSVDECNRLMADRSEADDEEQEIHSTSNYSIASSDTAALSIKLDENYEPIESIPEMVVTPKSLPSKPPSIRCISRTTDQRRSTLPVLRASASLPSNTVVSSKSNTATQTSNMPSHLPADMYRMPMLPPAPYPMFGYGSFLPPAPNHICETPIWPPYAFPPPPWYYGAPYFEPPNYLPYPAAPPYYGTPPGFRQSEMSTTIRPSVPPSVVSDPVSAVADSSKQPSKPTVSSGNTGKSGSSNEKVFRPIVDGGNFKPTAGSLFRPIVTPTKPHSNSELTVNEKFSRSLLEMVELMTPQLDSGTDHGSDGTPEDDDDAEDEAEREAWEAEERERRRMRRRHTRQWMRSLRTDYEDGEFSDTSV